MEPVQGLIDNITKEEDEEQLRKMKLNKAKGPDELPIAMVIALGDLGVEWITECLRGRKGIPKNGEPARSSHCTNRRETPWDAETTEG